MKKTGFVAIVGLANAGKSTLLNSLIKQKVAIVSPKPQTTRTNILGIWTDNDSQIVFVDTPGNLKSQNILGDFMLKSISDAVEDVDAILVAVDGHDGFSEAEIAEIKRYSKSQSPVVVAVTKIDITQREKLLFELSKLNQIEGVKEIFCLSARKNNGVDELREGLKKYLMGTEMYFSEDEVTDKSQRFIVAELIREKILLLCDKEIPHGIGVEINKMNFSETQNRWEIDANILVEKNSHKPIVLGKGGAMIKAIGTSARASIEKMLEAHAHLELWVKIKEDWRNSKYILSELGFKE